MNEQEFQNWYAKVREQKPFLPANPDDEKDYDYRVFYDKMPEEANKLVSGDPNAHFNDIGKRPSHPTFSEESIYSTNETPGGKWIDKGNGKWEYQHSWYTFQNKDKTTGYIKNNEKPGSVIMTYKGAIIPQYSVQNNNTVPEQQNYNKSFYDVFKPIQ